MACLSLFPTLDPGVSLLLTHYMLYSLFAILFCTVVRNQADKRRQRREQNERQPTRGPQTGGGRQLSSRRCRDVRAACMGGQPLSSLSHGRAGCGVTCLACTHLPSCNACSALAPAPVAPSGQAQHASEYLACATAWLPPQAPQLASPGPPTSPAASSLRLVDARHGEGLRGSGALACQGAS